MNFVKNFNFYGTEAKEIPCITDKGAPTETTKGAIGCFYMDTTNNNVYKCIEVKDNSYTWVQMTDDIPKYIKDSAESFAKQVHEHQSGNSFTFAFMTDAHVTKGSQTTVKSAKHAGQALSIINKRVPLDFVVHGGDYTWGSGKDSKETIYDDFELYQQLIGSAAPDVPNIYVQGNHDDLPYQATANRLTQSETFGTIGRKNWLANAVCEAGKNYGYVDFESQKVRVIFIDTEDKRFLKTPEGGYYITTKVVDGKEEITYHRFLNVHNVSKQQLDFIANKALDFSDKDNFAEWSIIVVSHLFCATREDWWKYDGEISGEESSEKYRCFVGGIAGILKAYKTGSTFSSSCANANDDGTYENVSYSYNFADYKNRVQNIIAVNGDGHICKEELLDGDIWAIHCPNIVNGREETSGNEKKYEKYPKDASWAGESNPKNGTAFRVITVDRENKKIYADCYGAGYSKELDYVVEQPEEPDTPESTKNKFVWKNVQSDKYILKEDEGNLGELQTKTGMFTTDYIDVRGNNTITVRTKNIHMFGGPYATVEGSDITDKNTKVTYPKFSDANYGLRRVALYDENHNPLACTATLKNINNWDGSSIKSETIEVSFNGTYEDGDGTRKSASNVVTDYTNNYQWNVVTGYKVSKDVAFIRICSDFMSEDSVITINEEIE